MNSSFYAAIARFKKNLNGGKYPEEYISPVVGSEETKSQIELQKKKKAHENGQNKKDNS